jgi:HemY protein
MRVFFWVLALFAAAVGLVVAARYNSGYLLLVIAGHRIELSVNFAVALIAALFAVLYFLVRAVAAALSLPSEVRQFHENRRIESGRSEFMTALHAYFEGRYGRAEQAAARALELGHAPALSAVVAARAAHQTRAFAARDRYLAQIENLGDDEDYLRRVTQAELLLEEHRYLDALAVLGQIRDGHTAALRLELKAQQLARNWDRVEALLPLLDKRRVYDPVVLAQLRRTATAELLKRKALDVPRLDAAWQRLPDELKHDDLIARTAAECYIALGAPAAGHRILETALDTQWDPQAVLLYSESPGDETIARIQKAEGWLPDHSRDAALLLSLGRLCAHAGLWGKARSYFEASLAVEPSHSAHLALAELARRDDREADARAHESAALAHALEQMDEVSGGRRRRML